MSRLGYNPFTGQPFAGQPSSYQQTTTRYDDPVLHEANPESGTWHSYNGKGWTDTGRNFNKAPQGGSRRKTAHKKRKSHRKSKSKRVHHTRRKQMRRHRHSRRRHH